MHSEKYYQPSADFTSKVLVGMRQILKIKSPRAAATPKHVPHVLPRLPAKHIA
jgi:hypothetical protein